ncbi:uncharacterized protein LY89DRAFT_778571 [Mollisia scopiformis]|uniref:Carboxymuconolactone decarboxylase-like domain-containing protein n=1 Tax=Mollisia scopiformis TaxID=149040 RepID=A0A194XLC1_MOLSC|nr:uncharacterized protein LY89DRAFT_778571 [Mollisia scopiformis]KUJ20926.1 hypothetical protein LY89DRAFT_778571 [Mollisia scopiformis]
MSSKLPPLITPPLLRYLRQHPQLPKNTWYLIAAVTLTILNRPDEIPTVYRHALEHVTSSNVPGSESQSSSAYDVHAGDFTNSVGKAKLNEELRILRRTREALLKTSAVAGAPKVINACVALKEATPQHLSDVDKFSVTGRSDDISGLSLSLVLRRGQQFFDKIYGKISGRVTRMMKDSGTEDLDQIALLLYGFILSNTTLLDQAETSYVLIAALIPQDLNPQLKGHLKGALNGGASIDEVRAVREVVIRICESAGMKKLDGMVGFGWQGDIADL